MSAALAIMLAHAGSVTGQTGPLAAQRRAAIARSYGNILLSFEANRGQVDPSVRFLSRGSGYSLFLTDTSAILALQKASAASALGTTRHPSLAATDVLRMTLKCGSSTPQVSGDDPLSGRANYFIGNNPANWHRDVPTYGQVRYAGAYRGIDLVYYGNQQQLEYDFVVAPHADARSICMQFPGSRSIRLQRDGTLDITAGHSRVAFHKPVLYQDIDGHRSPVSGGFTLLAHNTVGFTLGSYDRSKTLVIDPTLVYSTYLGGTAGEATPGTGGGLGATGDIAVDSAGNAYITGATYATDFPVTNGAFQSTNGTAAYASAFVTKLDPTGASLVYSTYVGGTQGGGTGGYGIAIDASGDAYITGHTYTTDYPTTTGAFQTKFAGNSANAANAFIAKLDPTGSSLLYSTYLGGSGHSGNGDFGTDIAVDASGNAYVTGYAYSTNFPTTTGAFQTTNKAAIAGGSAAFVTRINATGSGLDYSTYLGGTGAHGALTYSLGTGDSAFALAVDGSGDVYVTGAAGSADFPTTGGAFQTVNNTTKTSYVCYNVFVSKLDPTGATLLYSTYIGGQGTYVQSGSTFYDYCDGAYAIALDSVGAAYVTGSTGSPDFPITAGAFQSTNKEIGTGRDSVFVAKLVPDGSALAYSTYLGGTGKPSAIPNAYGDSSDGIVVDATGTAYIVGGTFSTDFPVTYDAFQTTSNAAAGNLESAFLTALNPGGTALTYSSYLGGQNSQEAYAVAVDGSGNAYVTGLTNSTDFPTTSGAFQTTNLAASSTHPNAFISKFAFGNVALVATSTTVVADANPQTVGAKVTFTADVTPASGSGIPTGSASFSVDGGAPTTVSVDDTGHAAFASRSLAVGKHTITASYSGDAGYSASSGTVAEMITGQVVVPVAATPVFSPVGGTYTSVQTVTISDATPGSVIHYTTDGSTPTASSSQYAKALAVSASETIKALALAPNFTNSPVATASYIIQLPAAPNFSIAISPPSLTVGSGQKGTAMVAVTPMNSFKAAVSFRCTGLPSGASCSFSPVTVTPAGAAASTTLTVSTAAASAMHRSPNPLLSGATLALTLCCLGWGKRRRMQLFLALIVGVVGLSLLPGCGGGKPSPTTSTVTVVATSGLLQHTATFALTVQ